MIQEQSGQSTCTTCRLYGQVDRVLVGWRCRKMTPTKFRCSNTARGGRSPLKFADPCESSRSSQANSGESRKHPQKPRESGPRQRKAVVEHKGSVRRLAGPNCMFPAVLQRLRAASPCLLEEGANRQRARITTMTMGLWQIWKTGTPVVDWRRVGPTQSRSSCQAESTAPRTLHPSRS